MSIVDYYIESLLKRLNSFEYESLKKEYESLKKGSEPDKNFLKNDQITEDFKFFLRKLIEKSCYLNPIELYKEILENISIESNKSFDEYLKKIEEFKYSVEKLNESQREKIKNFLEIKQQKLESDTIITRYNKNFKNNMEKKLKKNIQNSIDLQSDLIWAIDRLNNNAQFETD